MMSISQPEPARAAMTVGGRRLSYLDFGGPGRSLLALHGHFNEGRTFTNLARALAPDWRVVALDQRGHGFSDRGSDFSRAGYVNDAAALIAHLGLSDVVVLGHSLGGVNAYQLAARHPDLVSALIIEDIGTEIDDDLSFCLTWPHRAPTRTALVEQLGDSVRYLTDAIREYPDGWGLAFRPQDMVTSVGQVNGNHWDDWLATDCPALLIHGTRSDTLTAEHAKAMAARRPNTEFAELATGHTVHETDPAGFAATVGAFLATL
ncbi:alpha/beta fold hydrolase [Planotetraspora mira]|uniref:Alpha/beta hydrolase n=1 Tax=Planotetraspora mira TaxID=58121 RepID=A0A8J3TX13_9ACTN|nr:alpha/beta hydrolase [Planotetraspora mira]GII33827.1 alpha/beta hydrolase [Planotetraspora mira]